jgi:uncharacterized protein
VVDPVLSVPGVYLREGRERAVPDLPTGVPAFVGFVAENAPVPEGAPREGIFYGPVFLGRKTDFPGGAREYLAQAISGFFDNGGDHCYVVGVQASASDADAAAALIQGMTLLERLDDIDLLAIPDAMAIATEPGLVDESRVLEVQRAMVQHCMEQTTRVALLDALPGKSAQALLQQQLAALGTSGIGPVNAALYHPWIRTAGSGARFVPPSGHIAGIIARTDALAGVFKAPANAELLDGIDVDIELDLAALAVLNTAGINCLRAFPSRGIRVWGARTLSTDPAWRYLNVRRLVLTLIRWIDLNMAWVAFESNVPALWARIQRELSVHLTRLWQAGALQGRTVEEAYFVRCNAELNPPETRDVGQVVTEIGLAPGEPGEFIVISIQHRAGTTELI